jgi:PAS domain S-box-containing protein
MIEKESYLRIKIIFLSAALFLVALSLLSYIRIKNLIEASALVNHTVVVKAELEDIFSALANAESNQRGYFISRDTAFLNDFYASESQLKLHIDKLNSLTKDNPLQEANIASLQASVDKRLDYMKGILADAPSQTITTQRWLQGKKLMIDVRSLLDKMESEEERLLVLRSAALNKETFTTPLFTIFLIVAAIIIIAVAYFRITRELKISETLKTKVIEREQRIQTIFEAAPDAVITIDHTGTITNWNTEAENIFGYAKSEAIGKTFTGTIIPERFREAHKNSLKQFLKTGEGKALNKPIEISAIKKDSTEIPIELKISASKQGDQYVFIGFIRDISQRRENEEAIKAKTQQLIESKEKLLQSEEKYHSMVEEVQDYAIILLDREGNIQNWNKGAEHIKGYKAEEIIGKNFSIFYTKEDLENNVPKRLLQKATEAGKANDENWRVRKDGTRFWGTIVITALHDKDKHIFGFVKVTRDLTATKKAQDEILVQKKNLEKQNIELQKMNKELESFTYISSHDLQEPLRKIQTFITRIMADESKNFSVKGKEYFVRIENAASRMQTLIADLLAYSRTATSERNFVTTDLNKVVDEVKNDFKETIAEKNATVEADVMCDLSVIPFQFHQLMFNLIGNALKFSRPEVSPHIKIMSENIKHSNVNDKNLLPDKEYCHIIIQDNGIGFEPQYQTKIFELFQRLNGKAEYEGTGLGLAIVKKIVDNHEGIITATSELGKGARFDIYIPAF